MTMLADIRNIGELLLVSSIMYHIEYSTGRGSGRCSNGQQVPDELFNQQTCQAHLYTPRQSPHGWLSSKLLSKLMNSSNAVGLEYQTEWRNGMVSDHAVLNLNMIASTDIHVATEQ